MANVLFLLMPNYRDEEFTIPYKITTDAGHTVDVAGTEPGAMVGAGGHEHKPNLLFSEMKPEDFEKYDALVIPGGPGSTEHLWDNEDLQTIIKKINAAGKIVAAICYAVIPVVQSGILLNKHATVYPTSEARKILEEYGVRFSKDGCVTLSDIKVITAQGPKYATDFGNAILKLLK